MATTPRIVEGRECPNCHSTSTAMVEELADSNRWLCRLCGKKWRQPEAKVAGRSTLWSIRIETADDAKKMIRESAIAFYAVAGIQTIVAILLGPSMLLDAALFAGLGFWLHRSHSRVAATLLLVLAALSIGTTAMNQFGGGKGGRNIVLAIIVFWAAVRAVLATYKLPRLREQKHVSAASS